MRIEKYAVERHDDNAMVVGDLYDDIEEARAVAQEGGHMLVAYIFEFTDSELVEDYSPSRC